MNKNNLFHASKNMNTIHKIAFTGIFLGLVLLLQFLSKFMPFADTYIKLNFALLFILPIFYYAGPIWGLLVLAIRFALGPAISGTGYAPMFVVGHLILLMCSLIAIGFMYLFSVIFNKVKKHNLKVILISIATIITTSLVLTFLNQVFFTPLYWKVFGYIKHVSVSESVKIYPYVKIKFFMIPNYWAGTFATYFAGNLVKFTIIYILYFPLSKVLRIYANKCVSGWNDESKKKKVVITNEK